MVGVCHPGSCFRTSILEIGVGRGAFLVGTTIRVIVMGMTLGVNVVHHGLCGGQSPDTRIDLLLLLRVHGSRVHQMAHRHHHRSSVLSGIYISIHWNRMLRRRRGTWWNGSRICLSGLRDRVCHEMGCTVVMLRLVLLELGTDHNMFWRLDVRRY